MNWPDAGMLRLMGPCAFFCLLLLGSLCSAQQTEPAPLGIGGVNPSGIGNVATEGRQTYEFFLANRTDVDRVGRVVVFFVGRPEVKYGRDIWVPARSTIASWLIAGPATAFEGTKTSELEFLLFDRTQGRDVRVPPSTQEKIRSRGLVFRPREPMTALMLDEQGPDEETFGRLPAPPTPAQEAEDLVRTFRLARGTLSERISMVQPGAMPPTPEALEAVEHFVLASERIANDPVGMRSLRHWLAQGGKLWIMLDRVRPEVVAPLLGGALDFQVVDRTSLTTLKVVTQLRADETQPPQVHERPVDFVRVQLPDSDQAVHTINGWPLWFTRTVGRGRVLFTTLGPRGWFRPRRDREPNREPLAKFANSESTNFPLTPVPLPHLARLAEELHPAQESGAFHRDEFRPMLAEEIGYAVTSRTRVALVFGGYLAAALALGVALRRVRRPELLGWLGPAAAVGAAATFFVIGEWSRRAATATVSVAQVIEPIEGLSEATAHGLLGVYRPAEGEARIGATRGGFFELDMAGIEKRRLVTTDLDAWRWEELELPAGLRLAPFYNILELAEPLRARVRFGPQGVEGKCAAGPLQDLADAILVTPEGRNLAVRIAADGSMTAGAEDVLPLQQYLAGAVLSDQQQRRQEIYRSYLKRSVTKRSYDRPQLFAWANPVDLGFQLAPDARSAGSALVHIPLQWDSAPAGQRVHIPGPLIPCRRILNDVTMRLTFESTQPSEMRLRFQLPASVLPLDVDRAKLNLRIEAPNREVRVFGIADGKQVEAHRVASPLDPLRIEVADRKLLQLDASGGLQFHVSISDLLRPEETKKGMAARTEKWTIEYLELDVDGVRK